MAVLGGAFAGSFAPTCYRTKSMKPPFRIGISCIGWDPEGLLGPPQSGHIARLEFRRRLEKDAKAREEFSHLVREEKEQLRARREARMPPETNEGLVEYFLETEARDIEFEIARLRPRLTKDFFEHVRIELAKLRFAVARTKEMEDRVIELEAMQKVLLEGTEAYDKMEGDLVLAKERLMKILQSKDRNSTLLEMVERNELSRSVLALLDENIADAQQNDQKEAAAFMEKVRAAILKILQQMGVLALAWLLILNQFYVKKMRGCILVYSGKQEFLVRFCILKLMQLAYQPLELDATSTMTFTGFLA